MAETVESVLQYLESEADACDQLGFEAPPDSVKRAKYFAERDAYRYAVKNLRAAATQPTEN